MSKAFGKYVGTTTKERQPKKFHRVLVEKILGKELPPKAEVHHLDYNRANNSNTNLIVCQDRSYHQLLHRRQEVLEAGYSPNTHHKCTDCGAFKSFDSFSKNRSRASGYNNNCKECASIRSKKLYEVSKLSH